MLPQNTYNYLYCTTFSNINNYVIYSDFPLVHRTESEIHYLINTKDEESNPIQTYAQVYEYIAEEWVEQSYSQSDSISYVFENNTLWANYNVLNENETSYFMYVESGTMSLGQILDKNYTYSLSLVHSGTKEIIARLPEANLTYKTALKDISEIEFNIPYYINGEVNLNFNKIKANYLVLLQKKIDSTIIHSEYYIINKITSSDNGMISKQVSCYSYEYNLSKKVVRGFKDVRKLYDPNNDFDFEDKTKGGIINYILEKKLYNSWSVSYISSSLINIYRSFDISESNLIEIIRDCESQFNCIFEFDTYNKQISIKSLDDIGENKGLIISDVNLLKSISESINTNNVVTRLYVYGDDGLSIARINPQGDYIDNFNIFRNLNYMPQDLLDAFDSYETKINNRTIEFTNKLSELSNINNNINFASSELTEFKNQLDIIKQNIQTCYDTSDNLTLIGSAESIYKYNHITFDGLSYILSTNDGTIVTGIEGFIRNSYGSPAAINEIAFSDDLSYYVLVNELGYIYYSSDKINWSIFRFSEPVELKSICFGNDKFVAVGNNGKIRTSSMPNNSWSNINLGLDINFNKVIWSSLSNLFIAIGNNGKIYTSSTGSEWSLRTSSVTSDLYSICENNNTIVIVGSSGRILTSTNGTTWNIRSNSVSNNLYDICWDGVQFIIVGSTGKILTSTDGSSLTNRISNTTKDLYSICYNGSEIVTVGESEVSLVSTNGINWSVKFILGNTYMSWGTKKVFKQNQISSKEVEIEVLQNDRINKQDSINYIHESLTYENNFTSNQLEIISDYLNEERITITSNDVDELKLFAQEYLDWKSQPIIEFNVDIQDIFSLKEYQYDWHKIKKGDLINLDFSKFGVNKYEVRLIGYTHNKDSNSLSLTFSNKNMIDDDESHIIKILNNMRKPCGDVDVERSIYKDYQNNKVDITNFVYGSTIDTSDKNIITNGNKISEYGFESITDDDYEILITKNKIIMVKKDGTEYYTVVSPNGLASSGVNKDRVIIDYNGLQMYNSNNQQHGISMDKASVNQYADFKLKYNGNTTFEIYNAIDNIVMKFFNSSAFSYSAPNQMMYGLGNHDYSNANVTGVIPVMTQAEAEAKTDWLMNQLVIITE